MEAEGTSGSAPRTDEFDVRVARIAALGDPVRRRLYRHVAAQPSPVNRDQAAALAGAVTVGYPAANGCRSMHQAIAVEPAFVEIEEFAHVPRRAERNVAVPAKPTMGGNSGKCGLIRRST